MNCPYCQAQLPEGANVCPQCGAVLNAPVVNPEASIPGDASKNGFAIASLVLGILSFCCFGIVAGALAVIFGILGLKSQKRGMAIAGIVLGSIAAVVCLIFILLGGSVFGQLTELYPDMFNMLII